MSDWLRRFICKRRGHDLDVAGIHAFAASFGDLVDGAMQGSTFCRRCYAEVRYTYDFSTSRGGVERRYEERMSDKPWWDTKDFDEVVGLAVTELYQDSRDQLVTELEQGALRIIVADTLRNVHFMETRNARDEAVALAEGTQEAFNLMMDERVDVSTGEAARAKELLREAVEHHLEHDSRQDPVTLYDDIHPPDCFLCRVEAFLNPVE
jgi:hypothetical protein